MITVTTVNDSLADDGQCSLREAVIAANTDSATGGCPAGSGADTILFDASLAKPAVFTLTLIGANEDASASGDLDLSGILTIQGLGANQIIIDGNQTDRVFDIKSGATVTIIGVTIRNGDPGGGAGGGGILVTGTTPRTKLTLLASIVSGNAAEVGAGINGSGNGSSLFISESQITANTAAVAGGGIANSGALTIENSTLDSNQARTGGGIDNFGVSLNLTNATISGNSASDDGGGLYNRGDAVIGNVTFSGNRASGPGTGDNILNDTTSLSIGNSIVTQAGEGGDCFNNEGILNSLGHNLESGDSCGFNAEGDLMNTPSFLGPLQANGGLTHTHALLPESPAIDSGSNTDCPAFDQRGSARPADGNLDGTLVCDIGAFELSLSEPPPSPTAKPDATATDVSPNPTVTLTPVGATPTPSPTPIPPTVPCGSAALPLVLLTLIVPSWIRRRSLRN
jgi:CSLREA domain-containing protein